MSYTLNPGPSFIHVNRHMQYINPITLAIKIIVDMAFDVVTENKKDVVGVLYIFEGRLNHLLRKWVTFL